MIKYFAYSVIFISTLSYAQKDSTTLKYKVKAPKSAYEIFPLDNYLFSECPNKIKIVSRSGGKIAEVKINAGMLSKTKNDSIYIIDNLIGEKMLLSVYALTKDGKKKIVLNKQYTIVPYPKLQFGGVKSDSAIIKPLLAGGKMSVEYEGFNSYSKIVSFKMDILSEGKFIQDSSSTDRLTQKMRDYIKTMREGSIAYFKDVKYVNAKGRVQNVPIFRLFVIEDEKTYLLGF
jgi:hypothetical protein